MPPIIKLIRPRHWIKNGFVFAPLLFARQISNLDALIDASLAFLAFCSAASMIYVINDIFDVEKDKQHPIKRTSRPLASGELQVSIAWIAALSLGILTAALCVFLPDILPAIGLYVVLQVLYTLWLKHMALLDLFSIALGFVLRVLAGSLAIGVTLSEWMFVTTLSLALFLAAIKRRSELQISPDGSREILRHYSVDLMNRYAEAAAVCSIVFYSLYVMQAAPKLVLSVPLVLFGLFRYWFIAESADSGEDPVAALISDGQLIVTILLWLGFVGYIFMS